MCATANCLLVYASWLVHYISLHSPSAKVETPASSIWKHFYTARFSEEGGVEWQRCDLQLCVRRNAYFWVRLMGPRSRWQKLSPEKSFSLHFTHNSPFVKISAFWICLQRVRAQNPGNPGFLFLVLMLMFSERLRFLPAASKQGANRELRAPCKFSSCMRDHTTVFCLSKLNYYMCKYCLKRWYL